MKSSGNRYDNAVIESFYAILKEEEVNWLQLTRQSIVK